MKRTAPPPEASSSHVILKKIPHKQGNGSYTVTTTQDMNGQTTGQPTDKHQHKTPLDLNITIYPKDLDYKTKHHSLQLLQALLHHKHKKIESIRKIRKTKRKTKIKTKTTRLLHDF